MVDNEEFQDILEDVYPERINCNVLKKQLIEHGIAEEKMASKSDSPIHKLYFQHLASLPKRNHRKNRRGLLYLKKRLKPCNSTKNARTDAKSTLNNPILSEMEKLEARSKKYKMEKLKNAQTQVETSSNLLNVNKNTVNSTIPTKTKSPVKLNQKTVLKEKSSKKRIIKRPSFSTIDFNNKVSRTMS